MRVFPGLTPWSGVVASAGSAFPCHQNVGGVSKADSGPVCNLSGGGKGNFIDPVGVVSRGGISR